MHSEKQTWIFWICDACGSDKRTNVACRILNSEYHSKRLRDRYESIALEPACPHAADGGLRAARLQRTAGQGRPGSNESASGSAFGE